MSKPRERDNRMMIDISEEAQLAVRMRALKDGTTTGKVIENALRKVYDEDIADAEETIANRKSKQVLNTQETGEQE